MAQNSEYSFEQGSIEEVVAHLALWGETVPDGFARVEYLSEAVRDRAIAELERLFASRQIPMYIVTLPRNTPASDVVTSLISTFATLPPGVVSLNWSADVFPENIALEDSLRVLNFRRESLAQFPLRQIWWMPASVARRVTRAIPDLNSWFFVRLVLAERAETAKEAITLPATVHVPKLFLCYAHDDASYRDELRRHLAPLVSAKRLTMWDDTQVRPGALWRNEIIRHLAEADMGVLLVSANFLTSDFINDHELSDLLAKKHCIWFLIGACAWQYTALAKLQSAYDPNKPLNALSPANRATAWTQIVDKIMEVLDNPPPLPTSIASSPIVTVRELRDMLNRFHPSDVKSLILEVGASNYVPTNVSLVEMVTELIGWADRANGCGLAELKRVAETYIIK